MCRPRFDIVDVLFGILLLVCFVGATVQIVAWWIQ